MKLKHLVVAAFFCLLVMAPSNASGQEVKIVSSTDSLKGMDRFTVGIDMPELDKVVDTAVLRTAVELRLRQTGITVINVNEKISQVLPQLLFQKLSEILGLVRHRSLITIWRQILEILDKYSSLATKKGI